MHLDRIQCMKPGNRLSWMAKSRLLIPILKNLTASIMQVKLNPQSMVFIKNSLLEAACITIIIYFDLQSRLCLPKCGKYVPAIKDQGIDKEALCY